MNANSIFTRRRFGIDINVLLVMLLVVILCIGLVSYNLIGSKTCKPFAVNTYGFNNQRNNHYKVGETVVFSANLPQGSNLIWDCGDGTPNVAGLNPKHVFLKDGIFTVTAMQNGRCTQAINVTIEALKDTDRQHLEIEPMITISGNISPTAGTEAKYLCNVQAASYEWSVTNSTNFDIKRGQSVSYVFKTAGTYDLQVKVNNDPSKIYKQKIFVLAAPTTPTTPKPEDVHKLIPDPIPNTNTTQEEKPKAPDNNVTQPKQTDPTPELPKKETTKLISDYGFKILLEDFISNDEKTIADFMPYLYSKLDTKVYENGKRQPVDFLTLCQHLRSSKKNEIKSLVLNREENKNVISIEISFKKKGWF